MKYNFKFVFCHFNKDITKEISTLYEKENFSTYLTAIQYIISWADGEIQTIYGVWTFQAADGDVGEGRVIYCHTGIDRDVTQAQQGWPLWSQKT